MGGRDLIRSATEKAVDRFREWPYPTESSVAPAGTETGHVTPGTQHLTPVTDIYFPPRELAVMSVLWRLGSASVSDVRDALEEDLAYTSVLSALQTLEEKGYVRHEPDGRAYRYFPTVQADSAGGSALARIRDAIFHGSAEKMFAQMVADKGVSRKELERMRALLAERLGEKP